MSYTDSKLVTYKKVTKNKSSRNNHVIDTITIHCFVGQVTAKQGVDYFYNTDRDASSNYVVGYDGSIGLSVPEQYRSWCSSNRANDSRAVTIEVACRAKEPYDITDAAYKALVKLVADICKRNNIPKLIWSYKKENRVNRIDGCNMTCHRDFAATACIPLDTELLTLNGWKKLSDVEIGEMVATPSLDNLNITFQPILDIVEPKYQDTYTNHGLTATKDHRIVYNTPSSPNDYLIEKYQTVLTKNKTYQIPLAGKNNFKGIDISNDKLKLIVAAQADGHYMYNNRIDGSKSIYGLEFHLKKERKIQRIKEILEALSLEYTVCNKTDGSTSIRVYNNTEFNAKEYCEAEDLLCDKIFTWNMLNLNSKQAELVLDEILLWDGCEVAKKYNSSIRKNVDIINALAALNGVGSRVKDNAVTFRDTNFQVVSNETVRNHHRNKVQVSCVSVITGLILVRQQGKTFIIGNCPATYIYSHEEQIAKEVNEILNPTKKATSTVNNNNNKNMEKKSLEHTNNYVSVAMLTVRKGDNNNYVTTLQRLLKARGFTDNNKNILKVDGDFGEKTEQAVIKFQKYFKIGSDGICGKITWSQILTK